MTTPLRVGVTGATGQVGSRLVRHLLEAGAEVVAAVRNPLGAALCDAVAPRCDIRVGSLTPGDGEAHVLGDCDVIVNCALESSGGVPRQAYTRNRALVDGLLRARSLKWLVHFSTVAVYGELITAAADDRRAGSRPRPGSEYGRSKLAVERYAARRSRARGVRYTAIRLGHVYGAGIARSREVIDLSGTPRFALPFGGRRRSNAVHADSVGAAMVRLLGQSAAVPEVVGLAESARTWRDVFDWHTASLGRPPVPDMPDAESLARRDAFLRRSPMRETLDWMRGLPVKSLVRSPAIFDLALRALVRTPPAMTAAVSGFNRRAGARSQIARADAATPAVAPLYLSDGMPGPFLDVPAPPAEGLGSERERVRELRAWYDLWRQPRVRAATAPPATDDHQPAESLAWT